MVIVKVTGGGNDAESTYTLFGNQIIASTANLWWHTTETSSVNAWYSNLKGSNTSSDMFAVTLANQTTDKGLAYVLKADEVKANYQTGNITLTFRHQLAKIRVKLDGAKAGEVTSVSVKSRTSCTVAEGNVTAGTDEVHRHAPSHVQRTDLLGSQRSAGHGNQGLPPEWECGLPAYADNHAAGWACA